MRIASIVVAIVSSLPLAAQRTWVLDASGGGDFTLLTQAWPSLRDGDRLLVRPGQYAEPTTTTLPGKAVEILGTALDRSQAVIGLRSLQFTGLARGRFTLSGLTIDGALTVDAHAGLVVLHDLAVKGVYLFGCPNVLVQDVVVRDLPGFAQAAFAADDSVSINRCSLTGGPGHSTPHGGVPGGAGIEMHGGYTVVDHSLVAGGSYDGVGARFAAPTVLAATTTSFAGGLPFWRPQIAVQTDMFVQPGLVVHDRCTFTGALDYVVAVARSMPSLGGPANVARGATASYTIGGAGARTALLSFALDAAPQMHPQIGTPFWLFGPSVTAPLVLTTDALGQATVSVPIPNVAALQDLFLFAQGLGWVTDAQWRTTSVVVTRIR